tara:strand:- start:256 stop:417 length:162 start_codon:yes stop_codon:yes gene_type:complete
MTPEQKADMAKRDFYDKLTLEESTWLSYQQGTLAKEDIEDMGISFDKLLEKFK